MNFETIEKEQKMQSYEANMENLNNVKERIVLLGIFDREFLSSLNFKIIGDFKIENGQPKNFELNSENQLIEQEHTRIDWGRDVPVLSEDLVARFQAFEIEMTDIQASELIWFKDQAMVELYSFAAGVVHEVAHARSFQQIPPTNENFGNERFDKKKFLELLWEVIKNDEEFDALKENIDFNKFRNSLAEWSEIYALLYQREFLRRSDSKNEGIIEKWDQHILDSVKHIPEAINNLSQRTGRQMKPEMIYQDNHTLSFLVAKAFEKRFQNFDERIKALESVKK